MSDTLDWGLHCRIHEKVGGYTVSSIGRTVLTRLLDAAREMMFDCYPYHAVGETVVYEGLPTVSSNKRFAAITYRSREQAEEGHKTIVALLKAGEDHWLLPFGLENARRWGHIRRRLLARLNAAQG